MFGKIEYSAEISDLLTLIKCLILILHLYILQHLNLMLLVNFSQILFKNCVMHSQFLKIWLFEQSLAVVLGNIVALISLFMYSYTITE